MARFGFTTGSCSAAAAKAAAYMLLLGKRKNEISIETPKGIRYDAKLCDIELGEEKVSCAVIKDGGDDPDVTTGAKIFAEVSYTDVDSEDKVIIEGGCGVGMVTKPGLDQPVGNPAINSVPRSMIIKEVSEVMHLCDYKGQLRVVISVPKGEEIAKSTFNERLGIIGGISILGTSGIVEPMSSEALLATIRTELNQKRALGFDLVPISPGNYGLDYMKRTFYFDLDKSVKCSNFIADTIDICKELGFRGILLTGHIGKLVKVGGGVKNTHSKYGDGRMEILQACLEDLQGDAKLKDSLLSDVVKGDICSRLSACVATEDAIDILDEAGIREPVMDELLGRVMNYLREWSEDKLEIECMIYSNKHGMLAKSENAYEMLEAIKDSFGEEN